jgi:integrase
VKAFLCTAIQAESSPRRSGGKLKYFGRWAHVVGGKLTRMPWEEAWKQALDQYNEEKEDLHAGRKPRRKGDAYTVKDLCNQFLTAKKRKVNSGELAPRSFAEYNGTTDRLIAILGKDRSVDDLGADDFEQLRADIAERWGPVRLGNEIQRVRTVFKYAYENQRIDAPVRFGSEFKKPTRKTLRVHRAKNGKKLFKPEEIRQLLDNASPQLKAMILLGVNAGLGNSDCGTLPVEAVDLEAGMIDYARPKTGIDRRCPLWPETVEAIKEAIASRSRPDEYHFVFITKYRKSWGKSGTANPVSAEFGKLMKDLSLHNPGRGFYSLRHTFRTVADATQDFPSVRLIMGHVDNSIDAVYREHIDDSRLRAVAEHVRRWLFGNTVKEIKGIKVREVSGSLRLSVVSPCDRFPGHGVNLHGLLDEVVEELAAVF